jgi:hypothetical protein
MPISHDELKQWLIDLGKGVMDKKDNQYYSEVWSGDSKSLDIRIRKKHTEYNPDVIWKYRGGKCIFEIAFTEDWRAIAGEICLASMVEDCTKVYILTYIPRGLVSGGDSNYENRWTNFVSMVGEKVGLKWGASALFIPFDVYDKNKINEAKTLILSKLKEDGWVW